jgi:alanyl-tRNA synthetase
VKIDDYSMELCGGTHLDRTGEIGYFRLLHEEGIAAGVRRIEAITGEKADVLLRQEKHILGRISELLRCRNDEVEQRISSLIDERKILERKVKDAQKMSASSELESIIQGAQDIDGIQVVTHNIHVSGIDELRSMGDRLRGGLKSGVGVLGAVMGEKVNFLCVVTDDLIKNMNLKAGEIVKRVAHLVGGSGGGKPHQALAGGKDNGKMDEALSHVPEIVKSLLK